MKKRSLLYLLLITHVGYAQILDDSTKMIYGPSTTQYLYESNLKNNDLHFTPVDTSIVNIHRYSTTETSQYFLQDLGVIGTATRNLYNTVPSVIGARSGFYAYEPFYKSTEKFKYYDTKSPYSRIGAVVGGNGRSRVDVGFNRSDSSNFNIGIDYKRIIADKQTNSIGRHDRLSDSEGYDIYLVYFTPNRKYLALANFSRNKNTIVDQGGIDTTGGFTYFEKEASTFLQNATSEYLRKGMHFYHQFSVDSVLQIYQSYEGNLAQAKFRDGNLSKDGNYFSEFNLSNDTTLEDNAFITNSIETGIKGTWGKFFYLGYFKLRKYNFIYGNRESDTLNFRQDMPLTEGQEHYVGGMMRVQLNRKYMLKGTIDFNFNGNQRITGDLLASNFDVHLVAQQYSPSFMDKAYLGNHDYWINDFKNLASLQVEGGYKQSIGGSFLHPKINFTSFTNYIYYDTLARPQQIDGTATLLRPGIDFSIKFLKHFYFAGKAEYSIVTGNTTEAFPVPQIMLNMNLYYHNLLFNGNLELQGGVEGHWKSDYFAPDYRVSTHQFYIQDKFLVPSYLIADVYLSIKLGHAYVFAKFNNISQAFTKQGYFVAPNYIGKRDLFDFGFYWQFFD